MVFSCIYIDCHPMFVDVATFIVVSVLRQTSLEWTQNNFSSQQILFLCSQYGASIGGVMLLKQFKQHDSVYTTLRSCK